jgi:hypothetical protein
MRCSKCTGVRRQRRNAGCREPGELEWGPPGAKPVKTGSLLLFIYGTFSKNEPYLSQLKQTKAGNDLLKLAVNRRHYAQVLGFEILLCRSALQFRPGPL